MLSKIWNVGVREYVQSLEGEKISLDRNEEMWNAKAKSRNAGTRHAKGLQERAPSSVPRCFVS